MSNSYLYIYPTTENTVYWQMAVDEHQLRMAEKQHFSLRFYTWSQPALTLGHFQESGLRKSRPELLELPWIHRISGGGAILHHYDLTYSFAIPYEREFNQIRPWTCRFHDFCVQYLVKSGVPARLLSCEEESKKEELLCFHHQTAGDVILQHHKVVGSAQRRGRGVLMQHGSILLRTAPLTPDLPGIEDLTNTQIDQQAFIHFLQTSLATTLNYAIQKTNWHEKELRDIDNGIISQAEKKGQRLAQENLNS